MNRRSTPSWARSVSPAAARLRRGERERAVFVSDRERVVEVVVETTAREDEIPSLAAVGQIGGAAEAGLVVSDQPSEMRVPRDRVRRRGVVEVQDRDRRVRIDHPQSLVRHVVREQDRLRQPGHGLRHHRRHVALPVVGHLGGVGLVADLEVDVVEAGDGRDEVARHRFLHREQRTAPVEREHVLAADRREPVDVVHRVHRADRPHRVLVEGAEQHELDDDAARRRLLQDVAQAGDVGLIEPRQVEPGAAVRIASAGAARPRRDVPPRCGIERVGGDAEVAARFDVGAGKDPGPVQPIGLERVEVAAVVEVEVEDGAVVLTRRDHHGRLAAEQEVARVLGMEPESRRGGAGNGGPRLSMHHRWRHHRRRGQRDDEERWPRARHDGHERSWVYFCCARFALSSASFAAR